MTALVTGGGSGIGLATVRLLALRGYTVVAASLGSAPELPAGAVFEPLDIRQRERVEAVVERSGPIDVLVNCASMTGQAAVAGFLETSGDLLDAIVDTNLKGTVLVSQAVARQMVKRGIRGSIVHVASVGAMAAQERASVYCATKAAQVSLAQSMALELAPYGIRVNSVSPGDIDTAASHDVAPGRYVRVTPAGRRGRPEEVAAAIAWLASPEASFVTGANLVVDGGFLAY